MPQPIITVANYFPPIPASGAGLVVLTSSALGFSLVVSADEAERLARDLGAAILIARNLNPRSGEPL
jgi:hypothetical protein